MSYGSISGHGNRTPPIRPRHLPRTVSTPPAVSNSEHGADYFSSPRRNSAAHEGGLYKRARRGKSPHDILNHGEGVISSEERSGQFKSIPVDEKVISKLPRKVTRRCIIYAESAKIRADEWAVARLL